MRIVICIIYVHDDVDVSAYEYVNVYADGCVNDNDSYYCMYVDRYICTSHKMKNENRISRMKNKPEIENQYSCLENEN